MAPLVTSSEAGFNLCLSSFKSHYVLYTDPHCLLVKAGKTNCCHSCGAIHFKWDSFLWNLSEASGFHNCLNRDLQASCHNNPEKANWGRVSIYDEHNSVSLTWCSEPWKATSLMPSDAFVLSFHRRGLPCPGIPGAFVTRTSGHYTDQVGRRNSFLPTLLQRTEVLINFHRKLSKYILSLKSRKENCQVPERKN